MVKASTILLGLLSASGVASFSISGLPARLSTRTTSLFSSVNDMRASDDWNGDVVPGGQIRGCTVTQAGESITEWKIQIDGIEADLGRFSDAIYKQITRDAKQQQFQGFRPGTIPPHLLKTYRAFAMDECARETVLEAMQQNNIRPFTTCREEIRIEQVSIPPSKPKKAKKKKNNKKKKKKGFGGDESAEVAVEAEIVSEPEPEPEWQFFESMDKAINAGWAPGQSFSFIATNIKGQKVMGEDQTRGAMPLSQ